MHPSADEFRELLDELKLSPARAARLLGVTERNIYRWLDGSRDVAEPAYRLLLILSEFKIAPDRAVRALPDHD